jgi:hypothetical protein
MKRYVCGLTLSLMALGSMAQEATSVVNVESAQAAPVTQPAAAVDVQWTSASALPDGVMTVQHPLKAEYIAKTKLPLAVYRPSPNMPDIDNEDLLRGVVESGKTPGNMSKRVGYMPKLKVIPCATGCEGSDYEKAVKALIKGYRGDGKSFEERGEMPVQVRWFKVRPFLQRQLPYGADEFGISFMLEGKVVTIGMNSGVGKSISAHELAKEMGGRLAVDLAFSLGLGSKSNMFADVQAMKDGTLAAGVSGVNAGINSALGVTDTRSRIEPATEMHANLLPAVDGIKPNEIAPIKQMFYLNSLLY